MKKTFIIRLILTILMAISMTACEYPADVYTNAKLSGGESVNGIVIKDNAVIGFDKSIYKRIYIFLLYAFSII